jgi:hypothetical protein
MNTHTQEVFAITKKQGKDAGGLWLSLDGGKHWEEKTGMLYGTFVPGRIGQIFVNFVLQVLLRILGQLSFVHLQASELILFFCSHIDEMGHALYASHRLAAAN